MTIQSIEVINERISAATLDSMVAVFKICEGKYNCVFANTLMTRFLIKLNPPELLGVYEKSMGREDFRQDRSRFLASERKAWGQA